METQTHKVLIVDDHQMFIDGIKSLLRKEKYLEFVGEKNSGQDALDFLESNKVDLLITDISMPNMNGVELVMEVKSLYPEIKILVLTMHNDREIVAEILLAEAEGYILKNTGKKELLTAIGNIMEGSTHYSNEVISIMLKKITKQEEIVDETKELSPREIEIVKLIVQELSTVQIAEKLFISPRTVDSHRRNILTKTNSRTIVGLIKFAFRNSLVQ